MKERKINWYDQKKYFVWLLFIIVVVLTVTYFLIYPPKQQEEQPSSKSVNNIVFSLPVLDGTEIHLADYRGKKIVHLVFWATWCSSCRAEIPKLKKLYYAIGDRPYEILAINVGVNDSLKKVKLFQEQHQLPYKILYDKIGKVSDSYNVIGVPFNIIINKDGNITNRFSQLPDNPEDYLSQLFSRQ